MSPLEQALSPPEGYPSPDVGHERPRTKKRKTGTSTVHYPDDIQPPAKHERGTLSISTAAVQDDTTWEKFHVPALREQCALRNLNQKGKRTELIQRLRGYKEQSPPKHHAELPIQNKYDVVPTNQGENENARRGGWQADDDLADIRAAKKVPSEKIFIIKRYESEGWGYSPVQVAYTPRGSSGSAYLVTIAENPDCTCVSRVSLPSPPNRF
jgi:SAP domain